MKAQGTSVLIKPTINPEKSIGGVIIPKTAKDLKTEGIVIDCGSECETVKIGDKVIFVKSGGSIIEIEGVTHYFIIEDRVNYIY